MGGVRVLESQKMVVETISRCGPSEPGGPVSEAAPPYPAPELQTNREVACSSYRWVTQKVMNTFC